MRSRNVGGLFEVKKIIPFKDGQKFKQQGQDFTSHDAERDGVDLGVHEELLVGGELHDDDAEVGAAEVEGEELALLLAVRQPPHVGREAFHAGGRMALLAQAFL